MLSPRISILSFTQIFGFILQTLVRYGRPQATSGGVETAPTLVP